LEVIVDRVDGVSVAFGGPFLEVSVVKLSDINGVSGHNSGSGGTVGGPSGGGERQNGVPCELVTNRVPNGVKGADAVNDRAHVLEVTTSVSFGVFVVHESTSVERLVEVANVMDDQSESE